MPSGTSEPEVPLPQEPRVNENLHAKGNLLLSSARHQLQQDVIKFLQEMMSGGEEKLGRNPVSGDLTPFFQRYAWSLIETRYKEAILTKPSIDAANKLILFSIKQVVDKICCAKAKNKKQKPAMIWLRTVNLACKGVGLKSKKTRFGVYGCATFMNPEQEQLRALLLLQSRELQVEFWSAKSSTAQGGSSTERTRSEVETEYEIVGPYRERGEYLTRCLHERGFSAEALAKEKGAPTAKTIRSAVTGNPVYPSSLEAIAKVLGIPLSDIPNK